MSDLTGLSTNFFATPKEGFTTTSASSVASGAVTVPLNSVTGYINGAIGTFVVEPTSATAKQAFTGVIDTGGIQVTSVVWTEGTNQTHNAGSTVVDYTTATHFAAAVKGILIEHAQAGTHTAALITSRTEDTAPDVGADYLLTYDTSATALKKVLPKNLGITTGWIAGQLPAVSSVTENGNRSADMTFASTVANILTPGMRIRTSRTVAAPTQSTSLNGTTQYYSKATPNKLTFTDNFTCMAWVKLTSYAVGGMITRFAASGWLFRVSAAGQVEIYADNGAISRAFQSYQSLPLNKWVHVAASLNMAGASGVVYFDGVSVPVYSTGGAGTVLTQAGNLNIGATAGAAFFPGTIAQAAVFNAVLTQATIRSYKNQGLSGSETNLQSAYSFNNVITDLNTTTPNDLTANGSAVATNASSPFTTDANGVAAGTYDWAIVTKVATTVATVQYPEGCAIPTSGGISTVDYSGVKTPFGMPVRSLGILSSILQANFVTTATPTVTDISGASITYTATGNETIRIKISPWYMATTAVANAFVSLFIRDSTTAINQKGFAVAAPNYAQTPSVEIDIKPTVGVHTYVASCSQNSAGTLTVAAAGSAPTMFTLEILDLV